jgi:predicted enzyme related to lactoylglutathione lyase
MPNPVVHFEVLGADAPALQRFYANTFGWEIDAANPMGYGMVKPQESGIGGGVGPAAPGAPSHATFYIQVDDPQATLERVEAAGGRTVVPVTEIPEMVTFAIFADPEGNAIGLVKA